MSEHTDELERLGTLNAQLLAAGKQALLSLGYYLDFHQHPNDYGGKKACRVLYAAIAAAEAPTPKGDSDGKEETDADASA